LNEDLPSLLQGYLNIERMAARIVRMYTISVISQLVIWTPLILIYPCYPPVITSQLYDCDAPGPITIKDYLQIILLGGFNAIVIWQNTLDAIFHAGYIAFLGWILLLEYILNLDKYVHLICIADKVHNLISCGSFPEDLK